MRAPLPMPESAPTGARPLITTARLRLLCDAEGLAPAVHDFQQRNRAYFQPWDPPLPEAFHTLAGQVERVQQAALSFRGGVAFRWWLCALDAPQDAPLAVIGTIHFSQVSHGAFQNAMLGYAMDEAHAGRGLMAEALRAGVEEMFSERVNLHRIQAAYRPENTRSAAVLARLGFEAEGLARDYLFIDGAWRDHRIVALHNPAFRQPAHW